MQQAEGTYRGELTTFLRRSLQLAASGGEEVQKDMHRRLYGKIDDNWGRLNKVNACYMSFQLTYDFLSARIVAYLPGLLSYMRGQIGLRNYITGAELVNSLIGQCSWFIHVMPAIATLRANARRVTDLAEAIERVRRPREFYRLTGRSDFRIGRQDARFGLTIRRLELTHQGRNAMPFLTTANLYFHPGEWTFIKGESGTGKTCFLKAVNGLWPHGSGEIMLPEGAISLYATQDVKLQPLSLKQLVCLPDSESRHSDTRVAAALHKAGLGSLIEHLPDEERGGKRWDQVLSGGQKQKLVLARILLHQPGLLFLDEACGALDPESRMAFHQAIKENCPDTIVLSVMHDEEPPISDEGVAFYDSILQFEGGMAIKFGLQPNWAPERVAAPLH
jgi:ABC-type uncharacterized transport system fused permease/ATPase subunit